MPQARSRELMAQYNFLLSDPSGGLPSKWRNVGGGDIDFDVALNREGGAIYAQKMVTLANVGDVTCSRGVLPRDSSVYNWLLEAADILAYMPEGIGVRDPGNLRDLAIEGMARNRTKVVRWICHGCSLKTYPMFAFDNMSGDLLIESMTFVYEWPEVIFLG